MATGRVKWFEGQKGFGFIGQDAGGADVFVHAENLAMSGFKTLKEGQAVSYEITQSKRGLQARDVKVIRPEMNDV